jgi:hypothetical protein
MTSPEGKLTALACHLTKKVTNVEEVTYLSVNIDSAQWGCIVLIYLPGPVTLVSLPPHSG